MIRKKARVHNIQSSQPDWISGILSDVTEKFLHGGTPNTKIDKYWNGNIPWITGTDVVNTLTIPSRRFISEKGLKNSATSLVPKGGLLVVTRTGVGKISIAGCDLAISQDITGVVIDREVANNIFYLWYLKKYAPKYVSLAQGTTIGGILRKDIERTPVPIPPLPEQQKIAEILSTVDEAIENSDAIIKETQQLKKGLMRKLFTEGIGHTRFKETKIGRIPEEWDVVQLGKLAEFKNGKAHEKNIVPNGEYIVVNSKFISTRGKIKKYSNDNLCPLFKGDIVMVMSDLPKGKALARCFYIPQNDKYTLNQRICSFSSIKVLNIFLYYFLNRNRYFLSFDNGVEQTNLRKDEVIGCPVVLPSLNEQHQIASILSEVDNKIENEQNTKAELEQLKKGLMRVLLTGKIRVRV